MIPVSNLMPKFAQQMFLTPLAVGTFIMEWSKHERMLARLIATFENAPYVEVRDRLLVSQISEYEKRMTRIVDALPDDHAALPYLARLLSKHVSFREIRHEVVHGFWSGLNEDDEYVLKRRVRNVGETIRPISAETIFEYGGELQLLASEIVNAQRVHRGDDPIH